MTHRVTQAPIKCFHPLSLRTSIFTDPPREIVTTLSGEDLSGGSRWKRGGSLCANPWRYPLGLLSAKRRSIATQIAFAKCFVISNSIYVEMIRRQGRKDCVTNDQGRRLASLLLLPAWLSSHPEGGSQDVTRVLDADFEGRRNTCWRLAPLSNCGELEAANARRQSLFLEWSCQWPRFVRVKSRRGQNKTRRRV